MATKKGGLGKGLGALLGDLDTPISAYGKEDKKKGNKTKQAVPAEKSVEKVEKPEGEGIIYISLDDIKPNTKQPRRNFNEDALNELADSIKEYGVISPVLVRRFAKNYELVAGERRWRAARIAGLKKIPAIVRDLTEKENSLIALLENMQREDLNIIEEAQGIRALMDDYGLSQEEAAKAVGKSRPYIANALRLLRLPEEIQMMVEDGQLTTGHAKAIAGLSGSELQIKAAQKAAAEGWSVRRIESFSEAQKPEKKKTRSKKDAAFKEVEEKMSQNLGTKIRVKGTEKKGKIEIEYYSRLELDRLIDILTH